MTWTGPWPIPRPDVRMAGAAAPGLRAGQRDDRAVPCPHSFRDRPSRGGSVVCVPGGGGGACRSAARGRAAGGDRRGPQALGGGIRWGGAGTPQASGQGAAAAAPAATAQPQAARIAPAPGLPARATRDLAKTRSGIVVEEPSVRGMIRNPHLSPSIADAGRPGFRRMWADRTTWSGSHLVAAPRFHPWTETRSARGRLQAAAPLGERVFRCAACGLVIDREVHAARHLAGVAGGSPGDGNRLWSGRLWPWAAHGATDLCAAAISAENWRQKRGTRCREERNGVAPSDQLARAPPTLPGLPPQAPGRRRGGYRR